MAKKGMIIKMGIYTVREGKLGVVLPAVREFVKSVKKKEKGTLLYAAYQKKGSPHELIHFMVFKDKKAEKAHSKTPHVRKFVDIVYPNSSREPVFIDLTRLH